MKLRAMLTGAVFLVALGGGCSRAKQEAVLLSNQGDNLVDSNPGQAIGKYEEATKLDPANHLILYKLAKAYKKKEDWEKAASTLARAAEKAPSFAGYWFELGNALEQQAKKGAVKWSETIEPYSKCIEKDPNKDECYARLANAYVWTDDDQKALQKYVEAIEKRPASSDRACIDDPLLLCPVAYYTSLANLLMRLDYYKEAEQVLNAAKEFADPKDKRLFNVHTLLAQVYREQNDVDKQVRALEDAKSVREDEPTLLFNLGMAYAAKKPPNKADALARLKGFAARACKQKDAAKYKSQCEQTQTVIMRLQGPGG